MKYFFLLFFAFACVDAASAQDYVKHKVSKSETVTQIAKKYNVTPFDIYRLNPDAQNGLKENDMLLIPSVKGTGKSKPRTHLVEQGETLYSIARKYDVNVKDLEKVNADIVKGGLKKGQTISIPGGTVDAVATTSETKIEKVVATANMHIVQAGETKFSIAKKYHLSVAELEKQNPSITSGLQTGMTLRVASETRTGNASEPIAERPKPAIQEITVPAKTETEVVRKPVRTGYANYEVKSGETLFGLAKSFNLSEQQLIDLNPTLKDGVKTGMILKVPSKGSIAAAETRKDYTDLTKVAKGGDKKKLVLLLPFNAAKISADTTKATAERLKKDAFLNLTLDFYSGALMAIDSAKTLGLNIDVKIYDSEESKASSKVIDIIRANELKNADAVIGPFYQQHVEKAAEELNAANVPVISPLSKESAKKFSNLYQAMPSEQYTKKMVLDFMVGKGANIVVVSDPKRTSNREFITTNYPDVKFAEVDPSGSVSADKLRALLVKDKQNYVVLDTEKTGMILATTNLLLNEVANFKIQLVIIEPNETLDFEEISMKRLTVLKLVYPSMTRDNDSASAQGFRDAFKAKNRVFPNQFATRGFDVTFDTMLRLSQGKSFADSAAEQKTEQVESKFDYTPKDGGFVNKGIYILQYNEDLSVKEVE
ncbi:LysM peptidoglycan-binding domain-containing protein [Flavobacterium sp. MAH-1]|uniref:LysM peptidoglycan-binding domain-containing protein n=1 Tax=Flavobacterium agri TaxID=2743471 RepID=A0A7Y9C7J7_9FLAO|nr:LysM peptidoglycan-binding domain-containing protein [Flavobacterium agri]NUY82430.1 LysM peptidoglycan-binding domain-containing protein [Flavobacterium agri]NYA72454.1 LysM peptidoglycan-binding domain-containing protein [Flavobacterium agri]